MGLPVRASFPHPNLGKGQAQPQSRCWEEAEATMSKWGLEAGPGPGKGENSLAFLGLLSRFESRGV